MPGSLATSSVVRQGGTVPSREGWRARSSSCCLSALPGEKLRGKVLMSCELRALAGVDEGWKDDG